MKREILRITIFVFVLGVAYTGLSFKSKVDLSSYKVSEGSFCYHVPNENEMVSKESVNFRYQLFLGKTFLGFKEALGFKESQGDYSTINSFGYLGKYQFNKNTLHMIGIYNTEDFLDDSRLQEDAFQMYTSRNKWILRRDIKRYVWSYIRGVKVTESGILAAAHLAGAGNVKKYLRSGGAYEFADAFGTSIQYYLKKFSGYDTSFIKAQKKPSLF